jgi:hypothetical protein
MIELCATCQAHRMKNAKMKTNTVLSSLNCTRRVCLTGTPVQNDLKEFFAIADFAASGALGSAALFTKVNSDRLHVPLHFPQHPYVASFSVANDSTGEVLILLPNVVGSGVRRANCACSTAWSIRQGHSAGRSTVSRIVIADPIFFPAANKRNQCSVLSKSSPLIVSPLIVPSQELPYGLVLHRPAADLLGDCCHRYLPPKHEYVVFVRPTAAQARVYETLSKSKVVTSCLAGSSGSGAAYLVAINALRKAANCPQLLSASASKEDAEGPKSEWADVTVSDDLGAKLSVLQSLLIDVAARTEERVVVVSNSTKCLDVISSMCTRSGSVSMSCPP